VGSKRVLKSGRYMAKSSEKSLELRELCAEMREQFISSVSPRDAFNRIIYPAYTPSNPRP